MYLMNRLDAQLYYITNRITFSINRPLTGSEINILYLKLEKSFFLREISVILRADVAKEIHNRA